METAEKEPLARPAGSTLLIRAFGFLAFLLGVPYLIQGIAALTLLFSPSRFRLGAVLFQLSIIIFDMLIGVAALVIGVGLFLVREWARKAWLVFLIITLLIHFFMTVLQLLIGSSNMGWLFRWISVVVFIALLSFLYLSKAATRSRFR
ncbi:MAG TPA: hypothetical protein VJS64_14430 [Pyrinomonadaceae bacterium]|nr:hypothetical protein [Pyrinomonadaceae bacterium]